MSSLPSRAVIPRRGRDLQDARQPEQYHDGKTAMCDCVMRCGGQSGNSVVANVSVCRCHNVSVSPVLVAHCLATPTCSPTAVQQPLTFAGTWLPGAARRWGRIRPREVAEDDGHLVGRGSSRPALARVFSRRRSVRRQRLCGRLDTTTLPATLLDHRRGRAPEARGGPPPLRR